MDVRVVNIPKKVAERRLAELSLGIVEGLRAKRLSIEDAEEDMFNLDLYQWAKKRRFSHGIMEIFQWGMQLKDVAEIAPKAMNESYKAIEGLAGKVLAAQSRQKKVQPATQHLRAAGQ